MELDDELCLCFHVTRRKALNFLRVTRPRRASQMSECFGAGTGCGWCRPFLERMFQEAEAEQSGAAVGSEGAELPAADVYARGRTGYVRRGGGTPPPGATPIAEG